ncbi:MAG TPA: TolC family protein [Puia sp.]|uniref:TolC family protein n=1 Tax=Puia sp. TaxID=2045100 RepID=UPI002CA2BF9C|nr:TolC family protein [Puia sp.]HVU98874.1 TolC family protein [Puia sp.]
MFVRHLLLLIFSVQWFAAFRADARNNPATYRIAQDSTPLPARWNLQACLDYANRNNITLNSLRLSQKTAEQNYLLSRAQQQPNLSGNGSLSYTHSKAATAVIGGVQTTSSWSNSWGASSSITIYNGGYLRNDILQKNLEIESANLNILQSTNDITLQITRAYLAILLAKENVVYEQDLINTTTAAVDQGRKQYEAGSIARNAFIELQAQLATDKYNFVTAQSLVRQNKLNLKVILQLPYQDSFDIIDPDTVISREAISALDSVVSVAMNNRPEIKNGQLSIDIAHYDLLKARAGYLPILTATGQLSSSYYSRSTDAYFKQLDNNFFQQVGVNLSIPIFTRRTVKTQVEIAKINIDQAKLNLQNTRTVLAQEIEQAYINVINAQGQYDAAVEGLTASQEAFRIAGEQLKVGASNLVDYLQQKTLYTQAFQVYIQAKYNAALSIKIYDFYMGIAVKL